MPVRRRLDKRRTPRRAGVDAREREITLFDKWQLGDGPGTAYGEEWSEDEWRALWERTRDELLAEARELGVCSRPWAWWYFETDAIEDLDAIAPTEYRHGRVLKSRERRLAELEYLAELDELTREELATVLAPRKVALRRHPADVHYTDPDLLAREVEEERDAVLRGISKRTGGSHE